jgi:pyruvate dehydrogenase E1 component beta subunit
MADDPGVTMRDALNAALRDAMAADPRVLMFGEDVGPLGGIFGVTEGLQDEFGEQRVFDTPSAEAAIAGSCVGLAMAGWRPVAEMQFDGFAYPGLDQVIGHVAKFRNRTRGRISMPVVIRIPYGGGFHGKEHHSESPETYYAHTAGLKVITPSNAADAYRLLRQSIADPDPVIFLEPKARYGVSETNSQSLTTEGLPPWKAAEARSGSDCTIVTYGAMVTTAVEAADELAAAAEPTDVGVLDLRCLAPIDTETLVATVRGTGRAVVVHEAPLSLGIGAEIAARLAEHVFDALKAPIVRVAPPDTPYPPASLEDTWLPTARTIAEAVREAMSARPPRH